MKQQKDMIYILVEQNEKLYDDLMKTNELLEQTALRADAAGDLYCEQLCYRLR